ncbi:hypothetical protein XELAEV_18034121mg [Xenopus laevis]|uniref:F-box domain-containing protein n=1 Tax=Xenopus laevis TaxID=8355 RepID=A0A974CMT9_XENLA|nr:hypothetical protein XELAEV_18034121mg [Xenopus laevis]
MSCRERKLLRQDSCSRAQGPPQTNGPCCTDASPALEKFSCGQRGPRAKDLSTFPFQLLPVDCQLHIFSFLSEVEKCTAALVCWGWSQLMCTPRLWRVANFMRLGAFILGMDGVVVSLRSLEQMGRLVLNFLESVHCGELRELELNWTLTHLEPLDFYPPGSMAQICLAKTDQFNSFQTLFERLTCTSPKLSRMKLPFDWSEHSVALLTHFQHLTSLELNYFWVFKGGPSRDHAATHLLAPQSQDLDPPGSGPSEGPRCLLPPRVQVVGDVGRVPEPGAGVQPFGPSFLAGAQGEEDDKGNHIKPQDSGGTSDPLVFCTICSKWGPPNCSSSTPPGCSPIGRLSPTWN